MLDCSGVILVQGQFDSHPFASGILRQHTSK
jgi:hypothetical protein